LLHHLPAHSAQVVLAALTPAALEALRPHSRWQVIREPIPEMRDKDDRLTLASYEGLRVPLPMVLLPEVAELQARITQLHGEFPWASRAIEVAAGEMLARRRLGAVSFAWAPILLVGPPGTGKTRLARRLAEVMGLAFLPLGVGGSSDSRLLTGTSRGWASGEPSPIVHTLRDRRLAQILVLLDEVDKCSTHGSTRTVNSAPMQAALLGLLEPESSRNWIDGYLQVPCDLSKLLFVATANRLGTIEAALMSRLQPVLVPTPERQHYPVIVQQVVRDVASDWGLPVEVMPALDVSGLARAAGSVRELVRLVRREIVREVSVSGSPH
ncbi:AAA family ATPase, partial [Sphaerotilus montanus]|uniref:AAA family ATPase n=1 Tax=Sphaerotilus montanus TaxID=522889 RepID=UPI003FA332A7